MGLRVSEGQREETEGWEQGKEAQWFGAVEKKKTATIYKRESWNGWTILNGTNWSKERNEKNRKTNKKKCKGEEAISRRKT